MADLITTVFVEQPGSVNNSNHKNNKTLLASMAEKKYEFSLIVNQKSRIQETKNLSTDADSRTGTILKRLRDLSFFF